MAGLIKVEENISWSAASWVFDHVVRQTLPYVSNDHESLISLFKEASLQGRLDRVDLGLVSVEEKAVLLVALKKGLQRTESDGSASFADPEFYPGFVARFKELIALIESHLSKA